MKLIKIIFSALIPVFTFSIFSSAFAYDTAYYKDEKIGIFKVTVSSAELKNNPLKSIIPISKTGNLTEIYLSDSRSEKRGNLKYDDDTRTEEALRKKIDQIEKQKYPLYKEKNAASEDLAFNEKYAAKIKNGEMNSSSHEVELLEKKITALKTKIEKLNKQCEVFDKETSGLYNQLYRSRGHHNIDKKDLANETQIYVIGRFSKPGPETISLINFETNESIIEISLSIPPSAPADKTIFKQWLAVQKDYFKKLKSISSESVFGYIANQSAKRFITSETTSESEVKDQYSSMNSNFTQSPDLYSMASGLLAIQEALQLDRMAGTYQKSDYTSVNIETIKAPNIKSHPFELMLAGKTPKTYAIDSLIPADFYYLHFSNINDHIEISDMMDKWGTNFLELMQISATDSRIKEKYLTQLCLQMSELTRLFGDKVIDDMAICGNDPFLDDGTDLTVIFSVKNKTVFDLNVSKYFIEAKNKYKNLKDETINIGNFKIRAVTTPDGTVSSYSCAVKDFTVYSNSREAVAKIINTVENPKKSMVQADDFLYMRTIYETGADNENAFLYLSDSHIRKLINPEWKVERQRRLHCTVSMRLLNNAITFYYMDGNTEKPTIEKLTAGGYLDGSYIFCPDGGTYTIDAETLEPVCSKHRKLRFITPICEMVPKTVSYNESEEYKRFAREYNNYWSKFFDPVGIRIKNSKNLLSFETCILPLVENSIYNGLLETCGGKPVKFYNPDIKGKIFSLNAKINLKNQENLRLFNDALSSTSFTVDRFLNFIGNNVSISFIDSDIRFTFEPLFSRLIQFSARDSFMIYGAFLMSALNHPLLVSIEVTNQKEAESFLNELLNYMKEEAAVKSRRFGEYDFNFYKVKPAENSPSIYSINVQFFMIGLNFHVMVHDNNLLISTKRNVLLDALTGASKSGGTDEANFTLEIRPENFSEISRTYNIKWSEKMRQACHANLWPIYALNKFRKISIENIKNESLKINGYFPYCPAGGEYAYDKTRDIISCTRHGNIYNALQPAELDEKNELVKFFRGIKKIKTSLSFTVTGIMTKVLIEKE